MRTLRTETKTVYVTDDVTCNGCGTAVDRDVVKYGNVLSVNYSGGWASKLGDGDEWSFDLCEDCLKGIMDRFKIHPTVNNEP